MEMFSRSQAIKVIRRSSRAACLSGFRGFPGSEYAGATLWALPGRVKTLRRRSILQWKRQESMDDVWEGRGRPMEVYRGRRRYLTPGVIQL